MASNEKDTELKKILTDFISDLLITYPELIDDLDNDLLNIYRNTEDKVEESFNKLKTYLNTVFPERFFDILYENVDMFTNNEINLYFLPNINFGELWKENVSDNTRKTIWKYLQLILFSIVSDIKNSDSFKDTSNLFQAVNEEDLKQKLEETIQEMSDMFDISGQDISGNNSSIPDPEKIHEHINKMMNGKIGSLAKEIAEETAKDLDIDLENVSSVDGIFKKLIRNPTKLLSIMKKVGSKLDQKMKSNEISESELLSEASELMKNMPGMGNMKEMLSKLGLGGGKGGKVDVGAMQSMLSRNIKMAKQKEKMLEKKNKKQKTINKNVVLSDKEFAEMQKKSDAAMAELLKTEIKYSKGEKAEKSSKRSKKSKHKKKK